MMKILKINVYGFGKWQDQKFDLAQNLTFFSGPNEAGKSTLRQFILSVLFGFRTKRGADRYLRYEPKDGSKYGGELLVEHNGAHYLLTRVKGKSGGKLTITNVETQEILSNDILATLLGSVDETLFNEMFSFSQTELAEIRQLERDEFRKRVLKIGAVGSDQWISLQSNFEKNADKIYAPKGRVRPLNKLIKEHQKLSQTVQEAGQELGVYKQETNTANQTQEKLTQLKSRIKHSQDKLERIKRDLNGWAIYQQLRDLTQLSATESSILPKDKIQELEKLNQSLKETKQTIEEQNEKISQFTEKLQSNPRVAFFDEHEENLKSINEELPNIQNLLNKVKQTKQQIVEMEQEQAQIRAQLNTVESIPDPFTEEEMDQVRTNLAQKSSFEKQKQSIQDQIVDIQSQLLKETNSRQPVRQATQNQGTKSGLVILGVVLILVPWLFNLGMGLKIGLLVLGLVSIGARFIGRRKPINQTDTNSESEDLQTRLTDLNGQLEEISQQQQMVTQRLIEIGSKKGLANSDPQTWPTLQNSLSRFELLTQKQKVSEQQVGQTQKEIDDFLKKGKVLSDWVVLTGEASEQIENLVNYFQKMNQAQQDMLKTRQDLIYYQNRLEKVVKQREKIENEINLNLQSLGLSNWENFQIAKEKQNEQEINHEKITKLKQQVNATTLAELAKFKNQAEIQAELDAQAENLQQLRKEQENLIEQKTVLNTKLQQLADDDTYSDLQQQLANQEAEITAETRNWLTNKLAAQWIDETLSVASQGRLPKIITFAEQYFSLLTNKRYNKIRFNEETIVVFDAQNQSFDVGELSQGTAEQLYVAIRLAFVEVMTDLVDLPIIIDDGFVNFDATRKQNVFELLDKISQKHQVIYFTTETKMTATTQNSKMIRLE
ncbi:ATP-binding protein [Pediococcus inopinatus]|uniref:ATP-binding protein n=1 Tax=Pediococcus inopinatus TaxID=114090 RepID=UPI00131A15AC|nr:AAA family ATPase [Pediococcus inopinatus]WPC17458.1 AAA family ATPase [Pediococcus inopinatus]